MYPVGQRKHKGGQLVNPCCTGRITGYHRISNPINY